MFFMSTEKQDIKKKKICRNKSKILGDKNKFFEKNIKYLQKDSHL